MRWGTVARKTVTTPGLRTLEMTFKVGREAHEAELNLVSLALENGSACHFCTFALDFQFLIMIFAGSVQSRQQADQELRSPICSAG